MLGGSRTGSRDVAAEGHREGLTIKENGVVVGDNSVNVTSDGLAVERRPSTLGILSSERGSSVHFNLDISLRLLGQAEDSTRILAQSERDVFESKLSLSDGSEQERERLGNTRSGRDRLVEGLAELVRKNTDRENVDGGKVLPQSLLVLLGGKNVGSLGEVCLRVEERVDGNVASNGETLLLSQRDQQ